MPLPSGGQTPTELLAGITLTDATGQSWSVATLGDSDCPKLEQLYSDAQAAITNYDN